MRFCNAIRAPVGVLVGDTDEFGNHINEIGDIELRHLIYAAKTNRLYLQEEDFSTVQILHANRNRLAHHHVLSYEELQTLGNRLC